jgi:hypothetical protein
MAHGCRGVWIWKKEYLEYLLNTLLAIVTPGLRSFSGRVSICSK